MILCVVIDDNLDHRVAFGVAIQEVSNDIEYYPLMFIEEALTLPNGVVKNIPDFIFMSLDVAYSNGIENIQRLKNTKLLRDVPISVYL
jgi:CheY-like chemotaxis protein